MNEQFFSGLDVSLIPSVGLYIIIVGLNVVVALLTS